MSTEVLAGPPAARQTWRADARIVRTLRLALGVTAAMALAQAVAWPLQFAYVALVVGMLGTTAPGPTVAETLRGFGYALVVFCIGWVLVMLLLPFPLAFTLAYALAVFLMGYHLHKGAPFQLILFTLLALVLYPILGTVDEGLTAFVGMYLLFSCVLALLTVQLAHGLLPDPPGSERVAAPRWTPAYSPRAARAASKIMIVVVPAMIVFIVFELTAYAVVMVYIGILSLGGDLATGRYSANNSLVATVIGGLAALVFYFCLVAVPQFHFLVALTLATSLLFAHKIFSDTPDAKYYGSALSGLVVIVSQSFGADASVDANVIKRVVSIVLAGFYVVMAMTAVERLLPATE